MLSHTDSLTTIIAPRAIKATPENDPDMMPVARFARRQENGD
jgi:hypothetical protein